MRLFWPGESLRHGNCESHADLPQHSLGILQRFRESWRTIFVTCCRAVTVQNIVPTLCCVPPGFQESAGWILSGSRLGAARTASGNCCFSSSGPWFAWLCLWWATWGESGIWSGTAWTGGGLRLAKASKCDWDRLPCSNSALQILQEAHGLHTLKAACEEKAAEDFETCSQQPDFGKLDPGQLAGILDREDLVVSREEVVFKALFNWLKISKDREFFLGALLHYVDFRSISVEKLLRLGRLPVPGLNGDHLHRKAKDALQA